jgi:hypothetical protein
MEETYISGQNLIKLLKITSQELIAIENSFDANPDSESTLEEGKDYYVTRGNKARRYSKSGAYTIACYVEATKKLSFLEDLKEWFLHDCATHQKSNIRRKILDNSSSLIKRSNQYWISQSDAVAIFGTNLHTLRKMLEHTQKTEFPLLKGQHYEILNEDGTYYSLEGIYHLSLAFSSQLTERKRKNESQIVGEVIEPQVTDIIKMIEVREKRISRAKENAKTRDNKTCQITHVKPDQYNEFDLAAHHLYAANAYPHLVDSLENLITVSAEVHDQFHLEFMGGNQAPCTIDNFIVFVQQYYPENSQVIIWLQNQKLKLGNQEPVNAKKSHVLYLPLSRVT